MEKLLSPQNLILLVFGALLFGTFLTLGIYLLQRSLRRGIKSDKPRHATVRLEDQAAFTLATIKSVVTQLKTDQKTLQEELSVAVRRADENSRKFELIAREVELGVIVFDAEGYISFSNPLVRTLLSIDTWSRRRYSEIFKELAPLPELIAASFESGTEIRKKPLELSTGNGRQLRVELSVFPIRNPSGGLESVTCLFRELTPQAG
jgi:PAS domain-containing protein